MKLKWPCADSIPGLSDHQRSIVAKALSGPIAILGGSPGVGKTFTAAAIIKAIVADHPVWSVAVAGPTGKSAVRIMEAMQEYGLRLPATTIHRLLRVRRAGHDGKGWGFEHGPSRPLPHRFVFITEASMIDTDLAASLLSAIEPGTHILIEGDIGQLPPVGHGAPLRDMIAAGVPYGELTEIRRNSGSIVHACRDIRSGSRWQPSPRINTDAGMNLLHVETPRAGIAIEQLKRMLLSVPADTDPIWDCQVLCQVNEKSDLSRKSLNKLLQEWLNPHGLKVDGNPYRLGDKVICTTNTALELIPEPVDVSVDASLDGSLDMSLDGSAQPGHIELPGDGNPLEQPKAEAEFANRANANGRPLKVQEFIANGEIGRVVHVKEKFFHVRFENPKRTVKVPLSGKKTEAKGDAEHAGAACDFDFGYAITVHKAQGSQWKIMFVMIDDYPGASMVACRELLYTAISRAQVLCVTIGKKYIADQWCRKVALPKRRTFLKELLSEMLSGELIKHTGAA